MKVFQFVSIAGSSLLVGIDIGMSIMRRRLKRLAPDKTEDA